MAGGGPEGPQALQGFAPLRGRRLAAAHGSSSSLTASTRETGHSGNAAALPGELRRRLIPIEVEGDPQLRAIALDARLRAEGLAAVVLGLGPDGHVAFNQPATPLDAPARVVDLAPGNLARLGPVEPARSALTLGVTTILAAGAVLVVASGPGKAEALDRLVHGPGDPAWPVTWLRRHPRLTVAIGPGVVSP
ncbi:MAG TPA: 6-phosphogluconolactonase [Acidimicrobiia bacterium]|nr:6-phosphogluconolactonase [Acidimicrobiia bacterium]